MLIFQNGLFATFIPEILMVIGYILCLLAPGFKSHDSSVVQVPVVAMVTTFEPQQQISSKKLYTHDFRTTEMVSDKKQSPPLFVKKVLNITYESPFSTLDGLSYVDFSRPPPHIVS